MTRASERDPARPFSFLSMDGHGRPRLFLKKAFSFLGREVVRFENNDKFVECARERKRHLVNVVLNDRRSHVAADVECFVKREANPDRLGYPPLRNWRSINKQRTGCALADS